jgi:hypothetical protein
MRSVSDAPKEAWNAQHALDTALHHGVHHDRQHVGRAKIERT